MIEPREFTCTDCGAEVVDFTPIAANDCDLCGQCRWLRAIPDDEEREALRRALAGADR
jgi:hypothetical protein